MRRNIARMVLILAFSGCVRGEDDTTPLGDDTDGGGTSDSDSGTEPNNSPDGEAKPGSDGGSVIIPMNSTGAVGDPCKKDGDCQGAKPHCITGWPNGYCVQSGCDQSGCPTGSECYEFTNGSHYCLKICDTKPNCRTEYACEDQACAPGCTQADCAPGQICDPADLVCKDQPCTNGSCPTGQNCVAGQCVPDVGMGPGMGPGPNCPGLPTRDCSGTGCGTISAFLPVTGPGYDNYLINGETVNNQYRSFARKDLQMLMKYATAYVDCKAKTWTPGNMQPLGLGDMSEADGSIPGTSIGQPGHPAGTHVDGYDMDIAYFQLTGTNNYLREICPHTTGGAEQYHCTADPNNLDVWRHALFLGALFTSSRVRVIGVDGRVGQLMLNTMPTLCANGWLPQAACTAAQTKLAYEITDTGRGWFQFHHHHSHISLNHLAGPLPLQSGPCATGDCLSSDLSSSDELRSLADQGYLGEAVVENP